MLIAPGGTAANVMLNSFRLCDAFATPSWPQVLDIFIVIDESGSVKEHNYDTAKLFIKNFITDLDNSVRLTHTFACSARSRCERLKRN